MSPGGQSPRRSPAATDAPTASLGTLWSVVIAGEAIFVLPFLLPRLFRPTMLEVWGVTNFQFGMAFSVYGIVAMAAYFLGGPLADRFDPRKLMATALLATALGAAMLIGNPAAGGLMAVYGYFGLTTILLFWAAMIRVTYVLGGDRLQGTAFGILDAGRGLFAALLATALYTLFAGMLPADEEPGSERLARALDIIIAMAAAVVTLAAIVLYWSLGNTIAPPQRHTERSSRPRIAVVLARPAVWMQGLIVLCAYCGYKSIDNYGIYVSDVFGFDDVQASRLTTIVFWARPVAAIVAGVAADRLGRFQMLTGLFIAAALGNLAIVAASPTMVTWLGVGIAVTTTSAAVYGLRGIYFAVFDDIHTPQTMIGTAAGVVSVLGFLPDVFYGSLTGYVIDRYPGTAGYEMVFVGTAAVMAGGGVVTWWTARISAIST